MENPIEHIVTKVVSDLLHRQFIEARRLKVLVELQLLAKDDAARKGSYDKAVADLGD